MATFTNQSKNSSSFTSLNPQGSQSWADAEITWGDAASFWNGAIAWTNSSKNSSSLTNQTKN